MKLYEILNLDETLKSLSDKTFPAKVSFKLLKLSTFCAGEVETFQTVLSQIANKYGARDKQDKLIPLENGSGIKLKAGSENDAQKEIDELYGMEIQKPDIHFSEEDFEKIELPMKDLKVFLPFIE